MLDKKKLRKKIHALKLEFSEKQLSKWQAQLDERLLHFFAAKGRAGLWAAYRAMPREASLEKILKKVNKKIEFCFPRVEGQGMNFYLAKNLAKDFEEGAYGILEPKKNRKKISRKEMVGAIIPMLAFDMKGTRLGRGKGYYDRYFEGFSGTKVGLAFHWQYSGDCLPKEGHDLTLDYAITEKKEIRFS